MESKQPLITVIVPVYNAEAYIDRCLDSLLSQTYGNIEVVCVDDCSTDGSAGLLEGYASKDGRIHVIRNDSNVGAAASRQVALGVAGGEYIAEVDADDWIDDDALQKAVHCLMDDDEVDCAVFSLVIHDADGQVRQCSSVGRPPRVMSGKDACLLSLDWSIAGVFVGRRRLFDDVPYDTASGTYGDENTTHLQYLYARKVVVMDGRYHFTVNATSVTHSVSVKRFDILEGRVALRERLIELGADRRLLRKQAVTMWKDYIGACHLYYRHGKEFGCSEREMILSRLRRMYDVFSIGMLPVGMALKPGYMLLPSFGLFYAQLRLVVRIISRGNLETRRG